MKRLMPFFLVFLLVFLCGTGFLMLKHAARKPEPPRPQPRKTEAVKGILPALKLPDEKKNEVWKKPFISYVFGEKTGSVFFTPLMNLRWDGSPREIRSFDDARDFAETVMAPENTGFPMFNIREIHSGFME